MSTSDHVLILTRDLVVGHANIVGGRGRPPHVGGMAETGEGAQTLTAKGTGARLCHITRDALVNSCAFFPLFPPSAVLAFVALFSVLDSHS